MEYLDFELPIKELEEQYEKACAIGKDSAVDVSSTCKQIEKKLKETKKDIYKNLTAWQRVQLSRHPNRPYTLDYIKALCGDNFLELHGDRNVKDDKAMIGGLGKIGDQTYMFIGQQKGYNTKTRQYRNFGMANPEGYRKALRLMKMAEKFGMPIVTMVDTPGAYPGIAAETRHVAEAIAVNLREMSALRTPIVTVVIGEGGSGGALGVAVADRVLIFEHAYYSVISPEGCAAILWKDRSHAEEAAGALRLGASDLLELGVVDEIVQEPTGGAHRDPESSAEAFKQALDANLKKLAKSSLNKLVKDRYAKFRAMGVVSE